MMRRRAPTAAAVSCDKPSVNVVPILQAIMLLFSRHVAVHLCAYKYTVFLTRQFRIGLQLKQGTSITDLHSVDEPKARNEAFSRHNLSSDIETWQNVTL